MSEATLISSNACFTLGQDVYHGATARAGSLDNALLRDNSGVGCKRFSWSMTWPQLCVYLEHALLIVDHAGQANHSPQEALERPFHEERRNPLSRCRLLSQAS